MQTFALTTGSWLRRLAARSPLVRASDRIEGAAILVVLVAAVLVIPILGAVGTAVYDSRVHTFAAERLTRDEVEATATRDSSVTRLPYQSSFLTPLEWQFDGHAHTDIVSTPHPMKVGDQPSIWVDAAGESNGAAIFGRGRGHYWGRRGAVLEPRALVAPPGRCRRAILL